MIVHTSQGSAEIPAINARVAVVTALCLRQNGWSAEVSWWVNGELRDAWVTVDRLKEVK